MVSMVMGVPQTIGKPEETHRKPPNSWMVFVRGNPIYKWMMTGGKPDFRKPPDADSMKMK